MKQEPIQRLAERRRIQKVAQVALLSAVALVLSFIETMIPMPFAVPGMKLGLANAAVLIALFRIDTKSAAMVALIKVLAAGFLFGSPTMLAYSAGGTLLAFIGMASMARIPSLGVLPVSMVAAVFHNIGQLAVASALLGSVYVFATLPPLALAACITGACVGAVCSAVLSSLSMHESTRPYIDVYEIELKRGSLIAFVGKNGSGKSSAALQLAGLSDAVFECARAQSPTAQNGIAQSPAAQNGIAQSSTAQNGIAQSSTAQDKSLRFALTGMVFQDPDNQMVRTVVADDVAFALENRAMPFEGMKEKVQECLVALDMQDHETSEISQLSGGQRQKVAIAGILAMGPDLIIFDEASSMLDEHSHKAFMELLRQFCAQGMCVVLCTQRMEEAFSADRIYLFDECALRGSYSPAELLENPAPLRACGQELPEVALWARLLRQNGIPVPLTANIDALEEALCAL